MMKGDARTTRQIKCVVWDLDDTLWEGVLLEGGGNRLRQGAEDVLRELDRRGILMSIASRNDFEHAMERLRHFGIADFFLRPQIGFGNKSASIKAIAEALNIGIDTLAFVDDQPFERDEVSSVNPEILCIDAVSLESIPDMTCMQPKFVTDDSAKRRLMYIEDSARAADEETFEGPREEFLAALNMRFEIRRATENDLQRAVELTERTNQLNATGRTYGYDELDALRASPDHILYVCSLEDRYGSYGRIGLSLVEKCEDAWILRLLLMSCRVMSRGVGSILLNYIIQRSRAAGKTLRADFVDTGRNRMMFVTYRFAGFKEIDASDTTTLLELDNEAPAPGFPDYVEVIADA